jgi:glycerol-3-phosphate dehydrogenase
MTNLHTSNFFSRTEMLKRIKGGAFDVLVVGGGATGLGVAVDSAQRGYNTCLLEAFDFAKGTSSRTTKLVHGGVRYLQQLDFQLVVEALRERGLMHENAPHLVHPLRFVIPRYGWWQGPFYGAGLMLYDLLAGRRNFARSRWLNAAQTTAALPTLVRAGLRGGIEYHDGQFDDSRMAVSLARTAASLGAAIANGMRATGLLKDVHGRVCGVNAFDAESGRTISVNAKVVVNACGIFSDELRTADDPAAPRMITPAQGVHLVLQRSFFPGSHALMVPRTDDGRVLFLIPWHGRVVIGTTDTPVPALQVEPRPLPEEINFILRNAGRYLQRPPTRADVLSVFTGMRPLVHAGGINAPTKSISRSHKVLVSASGLVSVMGGKWTTYRSMAADTMEQAIKAGGLEPRACGTATLRVHGWLPTTAPATPEADWLRVYGSDAAAVLAVCAELPQWGLAMHPALPYPLGVAAHAARHEMARCTEDVLARRTRALFLDARAAAECAPAVAAVLAMELQRDSDWAVRDAAAFQELALVYQLDA